MLVVLQSLVVILIISALAPFLASLVPGRVIPEVVILVFAGAIFGRYGLGLIDPTQSALQLLSDLGLGFLFLKAGYEMDVNDLTGPTGRVAAVSWMVSLGFGFAVVALLYAWFGVPDPATWPALALMMTTTGYGTLVPIMHDRGLSGTRVGRLVSIYGSLGELLPVVAIAFLLSTRSPVQTVVALSVFVLVCLIVFALSSQARRAGSRFWKFLKSSAGSSSQPMMRLVCLLLVFLLFETALRDFDAVLGAFAAGLILRALFPDGNETLEKKADVLSNSLFQPLFFVVSGAGVDLGGALDNFGLLVGFVLALVLVRGVVVYLSLKADPQTRLLPWRERFLTSAYCTLALPLIVAITSLAQDHGILGASVASTLVCAAALTVVIIPIVTALVGHTEEDGARHA